MTHCAVVLVIKDGIPGKTVVIIAKDDEEKVVIRAEQAFKEAVDECGMDFNEDEMSDALDNGVAFWDEFQVCLIWPETFLL